MKDEKLVKKVAAMIGLANASLSVSAGYQKSDDTIKKDMPNDTTTQDFKKIFSESNGDTVMGVSYFSRPVEPKEAVLYDSKGKELRKYKRYFSKPKPL